MTVIERRARRTAGASDAPPRGVADALARLAREEPIPQGSQVLLSVSLPIEPVDPIALFAAAAAAGDEPSMWLQPDVDLSLVAIGNAWSVEAGGTERFRTIEAAWTDVRAALRTAGADRPGAGPILIGGLGFWPDPARGPVWRGFEQARMVLPSIAVLSTRGSTWLSVSILATESTSTPAFDALEATWLARLGAARSTATAGAAGTGMSAASPGQGRLRVTRSRPEAPGWRASVARFAGAVGRGRVDKVVLAREVDLVAASAIDVPGVLRSLAAAGTASTVFAVQRGERTFLGSTPELLVRMRGREIETMALAGSTRRGTDAIDDDMLAAELVESDKEREEHAVVVDALRGTLGPISEQLDVSRTPEVLRLPHVQHLVTPIAARLREPAGILSIAERLHPTPAVGGAPTDLALELIAEEETLERGWYAGPLGWLDHDGDGEFVVALRSGVVEGDRATLFAGCGIVADSDPDREWEESAVKLRALGSALGRLEP